MLRRVLLFPAACLLAGALFAGAANAAPSACANPGATPKTFPEGIKVRPYSIQNLAGTPETQELCVFLENTSAVTVPSVAVNSRMEEPGTGVVGPWPLVSATSINISGGVSVTCSISGTAPNTGVTAATFGSLAPGAVTDICCFTVQEDPMGSGCSALPEAGDLARHTFASGNVVTMPLTNYISVGGTTCGLVGFEVLVAVVLARGARERKRS